MEKILFSKVFLHGEGFYPEFWREISNEAPTFDAYMKLTDMADNAISTFCGAFCISGPGESVGNFSELPWHADYGYFEEGDSFEDILSMRDAVTRMAHGLVNAETYKSYVCVFLRSGDLADGVDDFPTDAKSRIQARSVQQLLCVDLALNLLDEGKVLEAFLYMANSYECASRNYVDCRSLIESGEERTASLIGRLGGIKRASADPRNQDKSEVKRHWDAWKSEPKLYKNKEAFARAMAEKARHSVGSTDVIKRWCRQWELEP